jgi:hypothetical protein
MSETPYHGPERRAVDRGGKPPCPDCGSDDSRVIDSGMPTRLCRLRPSMDDLRA